MSFRDRASRCTASSASSTSSAGWTNTCRVNKPRRTIERLNAGGTMLQDLRFALRLFNRHRGYAATAILAVALGVGANTAVCSVADSVLFRPLPFADADRIFVLRIGNPKTGEVYGSLPGAAAEAARATGLFDGVATAPATSRGARAYVRTAEGLDALSLSPVSREYLDMLGVRPVAG